jgi:uncharacterized protein
MKYLILLLVVLAVLWYWRQGRAGEAPPGRSAKAPDALPQDMVRCPVCSVHLPRSDALPGPDGQLYCCAAHRTQAQDK